ncbi:amino acid aminotransferase [Janthinobacterium sp. ROICE36]|nr:amino acid aminotransferase [Janthinobacterium sp. ROICE36]
MLARQSFKWSQYQPGVLAACVADMDLGTAPAVQAALAQMLRHVDFTYPLRDGRKADRAVAHAFAARMRRLYGWHAEADQVLVLPDLVQATFAAVMAFSDPGDGVIVQVPHYAPFREAVEGTGRRLIALEMRAAADGYQLDLERLAHAVDARTRVLILCNPHNPTGRVLSRAELESVLAFAERHALIVVSDEIHADLVYPGARHLPLASLSQAAAARTVTLNSATKSFNIAGLRCAVAHFGTLELQQRFHARLPARLTGAVNSLGIDATVAAWNDGQPWLDAVLAHLLAMRDYAVQTLRRELPSVRFHVPQGTYLLWLDCGALELDQPAADFFLQHARVALSPGEVFDARAAHCARLNFATSQPLLADILNRMVMAVRVHQRRRLPVHT